jgi:hypothetical protein
MSFLFLVWVNSPKIYSGPYRKKTKNKTFTPKTNGPSKKIGKPTPDQLHDAHADTQYQAIEGAACVDSTLAS